MTQAAGLLNVPNSDPEWDRWAFILDRNVAEITQAIRDQFNTTLPIYGLYPIPSAAIGEWLLRLGVAIGDIVSVLRLPAADIENVDLADMRSRQAWIFQIAQEIRDARVILKI